MSYDATDSHRDHLADANPELARKRQKKRPSEEPGASPDRSPSVDIVALPPDAGTTMSNAIQIQDEAADPYINAFYRIDNEHPLQQLVNLQDLLRKNYYLDLRELQWLSDALTSHVSATADQPFTWRRHYLEHEADFFTRLASLLVNLLCIKDAFQPTAVDFASQQLHQILANLVTSVAEVCCRILPLLPNAVRTILSRRDSAQGSITAQSLGTLEYITLAQRLLYFDSPLLLPFVRFDRSGTILQASNRAKDTLSDDDVLHALVETARVLSASTREVKGSWDLLLDSLYLFYHSALRRLPTKSLQGDDTEGMMDLLHQTIAPAIAAKHPRALPDGYHNSTILVGRGLLSLLFQRNDGASAVALYDRFVKSPLDALIPHTGDNASIADSLLRLAHGEAETVLQLLNASWTLQTLNQFIRSEIMDVRTAGVSALRDRLLEIHKLAQDSSRASDHPLADYAVRFLRENEITAYILGPESHAGLVFQSADVIAFLAATSHFTNVETDIIWRACSTSVEADFVKAAVHVLMHVLQWLDFNLLLHIAEKFADTPTANLSIHALEIVPVLFRELEKHTYPTHLADHRKRLAATILRILRRADTESPSEATTRLHNAAFTHILRFAAAQYPVDERLWLYGQCLPDVRDRTQYATTSMNILCTVLKCGISRDEASFITKILPITSAIDELCECIAQPPPGIETTEAVAIRLECILRLLVFTDEEAHQDIGQRLFSQIISTKAAESRVRNAAWEKLSSMTHSDEPVLAATVSRLWQDIMRNHMPSMSADLASPTLVRSTVLYLKGQMQSLLSADNSTDMAQILDLPGWTALLRFAVCSKEGEVIDTATSAITHLLFRTPLDDFKCSPEAVSHCVLAFTTRSMNILDSNIKDFKDSKSAEKRHEIWHGIALVHHVLNVSRQNAKQLLPNIDRETLVLHQSFDDKHDMTFELRIYGSSHSPRTVNVHARSTDKLSDLLSRLPTITGAKKNKIIAGGQDITNIQDTNITIADAGIRQLGVLTIFPRFASDDNIDMAFERPGPVEQAILSRYDVLEDMLDIWDCVAQKASLF
jgi:ubiquitin carboxyl-terminal hydrolase 34